MPFEDFEEYVVQCASETIQVPTQPTIINEQQSSLIAPTRAISPISKNELR